jgi:LytS/YehU family sensor histidine kinase
LNFEVPPLVIQTLVENSIKHGISSLIKGGRVLVQIKRLKGKASIVVVNDGKLKQVNKDAIGIGLENTKRRLDLVFGKKSQFKLYEEDAQVKAEVLIEI